jgi:predicted DNA-binding WGR domain protein
MSEQVANEQHSAPTLFGGWDLVRELGRIGSPGTLRLTPFETLEESERALRRLEKQKRKRGYL